MLGLRPDPQIFTIVDKPWVDVLMKLDKGARKKSKDGVFVPAIGDDKPFAKGAGGGGKQRRRSLQE